MVARSDATVWLERGLASVEALPTSSFAISLTLRQFHGLWPSLAALARLWGHLDPSRASGAMAAIANPLLRAVGRAAAMEFAAWPLPDIAAALARAETDWLAAPQRTMLDEATRYDIVDAIALAWSRHDPAHLPLLHARLARGDDAPLGLWRARIEQMAQRTDYWPPTHLMTPGPLRAVAFEAGWGLTGSRRVRACLTLAVHSLRAERSADPGL